MQHDADVGECRTEGETAAAGQDDATATHARRCAPAPESGAVSERGFMNRSPGPRVAATCIGEDMGRYRTMKLPGQLGQELLVTPLRVEDS